MSALAAEIDALRDVAAAGATVAHAGFRGRLEIDQKGGETDLVTHIDHAAQTAVVEAITAQFDGPQIVAEEGMLPKQLPAEGTAWVVDPIDGTHNFIRGRRLFATAVGLVVDGEPRAGTSAFPAMGDVYHTDGSTVWRNDEAVGVSSVQNPREAIIAPLLWWEHDERDRYAAVCGALVRRFADIRRIGAAQGVLAQIAEGAIDGAIATSRGHPWDTVGGVAMVRAAGGRVTDLSGRRWRPDAVGMVASNGQLHAELLETATEVLDG
jgi:Archaeal fructose-1,6-bisphosphatase and related enzymes of inositol monophosphatase family